MDSATFSRKGKEEPGFACDRYNLTVPGFSATLADEIEASKEAGGDDAVALIKHEPNAEVEAIIQACIHDHAAGAG